MDNKKPISDIKRELARKIEESLGRIVKEQQAELMILEHANTRPRNFRGKYIIRVTGAGDADMIAREVDRICVAANEEAKQNSIKLKKPLGYTVSTIVTYGRINMSWGGAKSVRIVKGKNILVNLAISGGLTMTSSVEDFQVKSRALREIMDDVREALHDGRIKENRDYRVCRASGTAYRLTYYDSETDRREQISVGDILIVKSDTPLGDDTQTLRNRRSDVAAGEIICERGAWSVTELE